MNANTIRKVMSAMGRKGGSVKSPAKKKGSAFARRIVKIRWDRVRAQKAMLEALEADK